jgi:hypothetical protein
MTEKESPKKEKENNSKPPKFAGITSGLFGVVKFCLGVCLLPFVYSSTVSYLNEFSVIDKARQNNFWAGLITLLIIYLFIWEPAAIYAKGHQLLEAIFSFFKPLVKVAPYLVPIYAILLYFLYLILSLIFKTPELLGYFLFLFGLSLGLHLVFAAKSLKTKQGDFLKGNYIFGFSFVYILNLILAAVILNFIFEKYSLINFLNNSCQIAANIFYAVFKQLFLY